MNRVEKDQPTDPLERRSELMERLVAGKYEDPVEFAEEYLAIEQELAKGTPERERQLESVQSGETSMKDWLLQEAEDLNHLARKSQRTGVDREYVKELFLRGGFFTTLASRVTSAQESETI